MISHDNKFVFIHIPRTGGTSVEHVLLKNENIVTTPRGNKSLFIQLDSSQQKHYHVGYNSMQHSKLSDFKTYINQGYYCFTFVRNPWARVVSLYEYAKKRGAIGINVSFPEYLKSPDGLPYHTKPQTYFIDQTIDFIGRFENLQQDFKKVCHQLNLDIYKLPTLNNVAREDYQHYYDNNTIETVREMYSDDINRFNYSFTELSK